MNHFPIFCAAQSQTAATLSIAVRPVAASYLRAAVLGGLAVLGSAGTVLAQDAMPSVKTKQTEDHTLALTVENPAQQRMQIQVLSLAQNAYLVNEVNHQPSYGGKLVFKGLPAGQYAVLLRVGREHYRYNVQVAAQPQTAISVRELTPAGTAQTVATAAR